jgi:lipoprotein Spr
LTTGEEIAARARSFVGVRFRPQGRDPTQGLDCVGLAAAAAGIPLERVRRDYSLRGGSRTAIERELRILGCMPIGPDEVEAGDILVCETGPAQLHLAVLTAGGFVHADAGLGMVVERPDPLSWPVRSIWRATGAY